MFDCHYTPLHFADLLVSYSQLKEPHSIVDFAAGKGSLLFAAQRRWPTATLYANDVDAPALSNIKAIDSKIICQNMDFSSDDFTPAIGDQKYTLILLNPPFSAKWKRCRPRGKYESLSCSISMAFVLTAVQYLDMGGELLAILPDTSLWGAVDSEAIEILCRDYHAEILDSSIRVGFAKADPCVSIVRIRCYPIKDVQDSQGLLSTRQSSFSTAATIEEHWVIKRGNISISRKDRIKVDYAPGVVHTTSLKSSRISERYKWEGRWTTSVASAGSILLPRVGKFDVGKLALIEEDEIISDCIISLQCRKTSTAKETFRWMLENPERLAERYVGTGASFITKQRIREVLYEVSNGPLRCHTNVTPRQ